MATRFDSAGESLRITSGLWDYNAAYSMMGWFRPVTDLGDQEWLAVMASSFPSASLDMLRRAGTGNARIDVGPLGDTTLETQDAGAFNTADWNHFALVRESATVVKAYVNGVLGGTLTGTSVAGRAAATKFAMGDIEGSSTRFDGRAYSVKVWTAALTLAEVVSEMQLLRPLRGANLWAFWPILAGSGERTRDYSGNARHLTELGTLSDEDPYPLPWGGPTFVHPYVTPASSFLYTPYKARFLTAGADLTGMDVRALLVMSHSTARYQEDVSSLSAFTNLDEHDGSGYARVALTGEAVSQDNANNRAVFAANNLVFAGLGNGSRAVEAAILYEHVDGTAANDRPIAYLCPSGMRTYVPAGQDLTFTWDAEGIFQMVDV